MIDTLMAEYQKELAEFKRYEEYRAWAVANPDIKRPWEEWPEGDRPQTNKARLKRLGITIREEMIRIEKGLGTHG